MEQLYCNSEQAQLMLSVFFQMGTMVPNATNKPADARHGWLWWVVFDNSILQKHYSIIAGLMIS